MPRERRCAVSIKNSLHVFKPAAESSPPAAQRSCIHIADTSATPARLPHPPPVLSPHNAAAPQLPEPAASESAPTRARVPQVPSQDKPAPVRCAPESPPVED